MIINQLINLVYVRINWVAMLAMNASTCSGNKSSVWTIHAPLASVNASKVTAEQEAPDHGRHQHPVVVLLRPRQP